MPSHSAPTHTQRNGPEPVGDALWAVVPVKHLTRAKQRLQACLADLRQGFTLAMLEDVLRALADSRLVGRAACVSGDPEVAELAGSFRAEVIPDLPASGMNEAIRLGVDAARRHGARRTVILPGDVPLATGREIDRMLREMACARAPDGQPVIGLAPSADGRGTNFLCLDTDADFAIRYGPDSFSRHRSLALAGGFKVVPLSSGPLALDIDNEEDLRAFVARCTGHPEYRRTRAWRFLSRNGLLDALQ